MDETKLDNKTIDRMAELAGANLVLTKMVEKLVLEVATLRLQIQHPLATEEVITEAGDIIPEEEEEDLEKEIIEAPVKFYVPKGSV